MSILLARAGSSAHLERIVADLAGELAKLRERVVELESGRSAAERMTGEIRGLGQRLDAELEKFGALARQVVELDRKVEEGAKITDAQRRRLVALAKSVDWETDSLRKSLEVLLAQGLISDERTAEAASSAGPLPPAVEI